MVQEHSDRELVDHLLGIDGDVFLVFQMVYFLDEYFESLAPQLKFVLLGIIEIILREDSGFGCVRFLYEGG